MSYLIEHTVLYDLHWLHLTALIVLAVVIFFTVRNLKKMREIRNDLEHELSSGSAEVALEKVPDEVSSEDTLKARKKAKEDREWRKIGR